MAFESTAVAGSGISALREVHSLRAMRGSNAVITNYEDVNSVLGIIQNSGLAVGGTAVQLTSPENRLRGRRRVIVQNLGAGDLYLGNSNVTTSNGLEIGANTSLTLDVLDLGDIWVVSASTSDVRVVELK